jgi:Arc/MetJ family transcription regulator
MRTNIEINDTLMEKAKQLSNLTTKKAIVEKALKTYVAIESQKKLLDYWGKIELDEKAFE